MLALVEVPQHRLPVLAPRGAERPVRRHRDRVEEARVAVVIRLQLAVGQVPHLSASAAVTNGQLIKFFNGIEILSNIILAIE